MATPRKNEAEIEIMSNNLGNTLKKEINSKERNNVLKFLLQRFER